MVLDSIEEDDFNNFVELKVEPLSSVVCERSGTRFSAQFSFESTITNTTDKTASSQSSSIGINSTAVVWFPDLPFLERNARGRTQWGSGFTSFFSWGLLPYKSAKFDFNVAVSCFQESRDYVISYRLTPAGSASQTVRFKRVSCDN